MLELKFAITEQQKSVFTAFLRDVCSIGQWITDPIICSSTKSTMGRWQSQLSLFSLHTCTVYTL